MYLKVCGLREKDNVEAVLQLQPNWAGFIFTPASPRYFNDAVEGADIAGINTHVKKVGVFVNQTKEEIVALHKQYGLDMIQLHGDESAEFCMELHQDGMKLIKAFRINDDFDFDVVNAYTPHIAMLLFDTAGKSFGGNGIAFNWDALNGKRFHKPFLLSGGIGLESIEELKRFSHPDMIGMDVNSRFETSVGVKDVDALKLFKQQIA